MLATPGTGLADPQGVDGTGSRPRAGDECRSLVATGTPLWTPRVKGRRRS